MKKNISFPFELNPWTNQIKNCQEEERIKTSIFLILSTHVEERRMNATFGSRMKDYLFEVMNDETQDLIEREIIASLTENEPRIFDIEISFQRLGNTLNIQIKYMIIESMEADQLALVFEL